jgi:hypothetical protein
VIGTLRFYGGLQQTAHAKTPALIILTQDRALLKARPPLPTRGQHMYSGP